MLQVLKKHHPVFAFGILFNRIVPVGVARYRRFGVFELRGAADDVSPDPLKNSNTDIRLAVVKDGASRQEVDRLTGVQKSEIDSETICVAAESESEVVGGLYLQPNIFYESELGLNIKLPDDALWLFSASVRKDARRQGVYSRMLSFVRHEQAFINHRILFAVDLFNRPSLKAHSAQTDRELGRYLAARLFRFGWTTGTGLGVLGPKSTSNLHRQPMLLDLSSVNRRKD